MEGVLPTAPHCLCLSWWGKLLSGHSQDQPVSKQVFRVGNCLARKKTACIFWKDFRQPNRSRLTHLSFDFFFEINKYILLTESNNNRMIILYEVNTAIQFKRSQVKNKLPFFKLGSPFWSYNQKNDFIVKTHVFFFLLHLNAHESM